jgi:hypothetical protein
VELAGLRRTNSACIDTTYIQAGCPVALAMKKHDVHCTSTITATALVDVLIPSTWILEKNEQVLDPVLIM